MVLISNVISKAFNTFQMWTFILKSVILLSCGYVSQTANLSSSQPIPWSLLESVTGVSELSIDCVGVLKIDDLSPSNCSTCFGVIPKGTGTYALFYSPRNGASLDYDKANFYTFSMSCDEGGGIKNTGTVVLNVIPNFSPLFQDSSSIRTVTTGTVIGGVVYNPKPFDPENDQLTFTLEENPNNGFFTIDGNGIVRAKKNLNTFCNHQETITITMQDGTNPPVSKTVTLDPGGNTKPTFKDWNRIITIPENTVLDLRITDNLGTQGSCIVTVVPPEYSSYIDSTTKCPLGSSSSLRTPVGGKTFNYEVDPPLNISFVLDNGNCPSDPIWLFLQWSDVPEPPKLTLHKMDFITKEGMVEIEPEYVVQDDDQPDKHVYSFAEPELVNPNFKIDPDTGRIYTQKYYQMDCDLDKNGFVFKVQVTDKNGNVSAPPVNVKLNLTDVNDNRPRFTRRFDPTPISYPDCLQPFTLTDLSEDVTDDDCEVTTNKAVEFLEASSGSLSISKHGVVRLTKPPIAGQVDILQIRAIDKGEPPLLSETETISIRGFPCPTTQPAVVPVDNNNINYNNNNDNNDNNDNNNYNNDNNNYNNDNNNNNNNGVAATVVPEVVEAGFFDKPCIIALIALAGLLGLLLLPLLLYLYYRFCCRNACYKRRNPPLKANKIKPNKMGGDGGGNENSSSGGVGNGDGGESGYGGAVGDVVGDANEGKDFQDKGFKDQPSKKALPATVEKA